MGVRWACRLLGLVAALALVASCSQATGPRPPGPMRVVVTVPPLKGLVAPLAPPGATVTALISPGQSEHGYEFTRADVQALQDADVVVYVGLGLEPQVEEFLRNHPSSRRQVVSFAAAVGADKVPAAAQDDHDNHGDADHDAVHDDDGHHHGPIDPHLWLDPDLVLKLVPALDRAVASAATEETGQPPADARGALEAKIRAMDDECKGKLALLSGKSIVTHHAAWGRFAQHFGLTVAAVIRPIEVSESSPADLNRAVEAIKKQGARAVFVEPQFNADAARRIAEQAGVKLGTLDPLGNGDWFETMRKNVDALVKTLGD